MKILYLTSRLPIPPLVKGDTLRDFYLIKELASRGHEVYLVSFYRADEITDPHLAILNSYCREVTLIPFAQGKQSLHLLKGIYSFTPLQVLLHRSPTFQEAVDRIIAEGKYDVAYVHFARLADFLRKYNIPKIIDFQDSFEKNMRDRFLKEKNIIVKFIALLESKKMKIYEREIASDYSFVTVVSERDIEPELQNMVVVPNGTQDLQTMEEADKQAQGLLFIGNMSYFPNEDAALFLIKEVMPILSQRIPDLKLYIVGSKPGKKLRKYHSDNIIVTGFVPDIYPYFAKSRISVAPLRYGTGIQNRILDAMVVGIPQIVSVKAAEGFKNVHGNEFIVSQCRKQEFSEKIVRLWGDYEIQKRLVENGRKYVKENYSWEKSVSVLEKFISSSE